MKNVIPFLLILAFASCKEEEFDPNQTREFSIQSAATGANYAIKVALPADYDPSAHSYATIYVLDGEQNFNHVAEACEKFSSNYSTQNVLVVSIGYGNDRAFDYTPTKASEGGGGAENFMHFLANELIPTMERDFAADTLRQSRVILGHSFGGLLAAYAFTNFNEVFGNYLMLSPSIWYDNEILLKFEQDHRDLNKTANQLVFMGLGSLESSGRMMAPFEAFYLRLQGKYPSIEITKHIVQHMDHGGSKNPNIQKSLNFYFQNR